MMMQEMRVEPIEGWYPPEEVPLPTGLNTDRVEWMIEMLDTSGQHMAALRVAERHGQAYVAPALPERWREGDPKDPWLEELRADARRVCEKCHMAMPMTGRCDNCE